MALQHSRLLRVLALGSRSRSTAVRALRAYGFDLQLLTWHAFQRERGSALSRPDVALPFVRSMACEHHCHLVLQLRDRWPTVPIVVALGQDSPDMLQLCALADAQDFTPYSSSVAALAVRLRRAVDRMDASARCHGPCADIEYDALRGILRADGESVTLSPRESQLFNLLLTCTGKPLSAIEITQHAWGMAPGILQPNNVVAFYVNSLRKKLARVGHGKLLRTIRGSGYTLMPCNADSATVRQHSSTAAEYERASSHSDRRATIGL